MPRAYWALSQIENAYPSSIPLGGPYKALNTLRDRLPTLRRDMRGIFEIENPKHLKLLKQTANEIKRDYDDFEWNRGDLQIKLDGLKRATSNK